MKTVFYFRLLLFASFLSGCGELYTEEDKAGFDKEIQAFCERKNWNCERSETGLYYEILEEGNGGQIPLDAKIQVNYKGYLLNGKVFDDQTDAPIVLHTPTLIDGWREMLLFVTVGSNIRFVVPPHLGYKSRKMGDIPANAILVFEAKILGLE